MILSSSQKSAFRQQLGIAVRLDGYILYKTENRGSLVSVLEQEVHLFSLKNSIKFFLCIYKNKIMIPAKKVHFFINEKM